jgi:hypothetical protein
MSVPARSSTIHAPLEVYSVHFAFPGGQAIKLRDHVTDHLVGTSPEWVVASRNELVAYVRGTRPEMQVVFHGTPAANGRYRMGANGPLFQVEERDVTLVFDLASGFSTPETFRANGNLPDQIGLHTTTLDWYIRDQPTLSQCLLAGTSTHRIATTWRAFVPAPAPEASLTDWVYSRLMEWTCQWAAGQNDEKAICDAIIANVEHSGLRYGVFGVRTIREMLHRQGAMCGVWYQAFQQMAHCQGVFVYRRRFLVDWRTMPQGEEHWCAIVILDGGLNQTVPTDDPSEFHDNHTAFPIPAGTSVPIVTVTEPRYRFWGIPNYYFDGHCVNFLVYNNHLYLYDACFGVGPIQINAPLPVNNVNLAQGGASLAPFKTAYFDGAIDYMLGSIRNGSTLLRSIFVYPPGIAFANGMTVRTVDIPQVLNGNDGLTFRWGN